MGVFGWDGEHLAAELPHGARALFTTRRGGVSRGPFASLDLGRTDPALERDDPAAVAENRRRAAALAGGRALRLARQVHGAGVATDEDPAEEADGQVTRRADVAATVLVADCLPVAIAAPGRVAVLHAGWRGLAAGVLRRGVEALGDGPKAAAIGPGIGVCCFEVGDEVREAFAAHPAARRGRHFDLKLIARRELEAAGVAEIADCDLCTACDPERFFSHRRDGDETGRQAGMAWRES
ncbi:MAG: laccase domain-containing protein [Solirubrobacteraceae bacterium]|nr:laccase domain-containing protein [Solirubrobacteraceae bacterium]